jgi:hypothetical protein
MQCRNDIWRQCFGEATSYILLYTSDLLLSTNAVRVTTTQSGSNDESESQVSAGKLKRQHRALP